MSNPQNPQNQQNPQSQPHPGQFPQGQFPQGPGMPAAPEKKKGKKWPWIVGILAVVVVIGVATGGGDDEKPAAGISTTEEVVVSEDGGETVVEQAVEEEAPAAEGKPGLNTPVRDGKFEFVVTNVESGLSSVGDNPYLTEEAQGAFTVVTMTVTNTSDKAKGLSASDQKMIDEQGREFSPNTMASIVLESNASIWDELNPGITTTMHVVYDMPVDAVPSEMKLHDSMFSRGATVSLR